MTEFERFMSKVQKTDSGCWEWMAYCYPNGYGQFHIGRKPIYAHRYAYEHFVGKIPDGLQIDHLCRNRACVRPDHLEAVTHHENIRRGNAGKNNSDKTHCKRGHEFNAKNTYTDKRGRRQCRACRRIRHRIDYRGRA